MPRPPFPAPDDVTGLDQKILDRVSPIEATQGQETTPLLSSGGLDLFLAKSGFGVWWFGAWWSLDIQELIAPIAEEFSTCASALRSEDSASRLNHHLIKHHAPTPNHQAAPNDQTPNHH
jgi:hypothetical protein